MPSSNAQNLHVLILKRFISFYLYEKSIVENSKNQYVLSSPGSVVNFILLSFLQFKAMFYQKSL